VARGALIGKVGNTGFSTGPHLHWEMRVRAEATDPKQWANRLFPL
jgi:murein DD-endopeptidase MepM/ murein hydrolase activator NlpD